MGVGDFIIIVLSNCVVNQKWKQEMDMVFPYAFQVYGKCCGWRRIFIHIANRCHMEHAIHSKGFLFERKFKPFYITLLGTGSDVIFILPLNGTTAQFAGRGSWNGSHKLNTNLSICNCNIQLSGEFITRFLNHLTDLYPI